MTNKQTIKTILLGGAMCLSLSACSDSTKETLGLVNTTPDEFSVITRAPLSVPPDYALRPPRPGQSRPMEQSTQQVARQTVFGSEDVKDNGVATSSTASTNNEFLNKIGVADTDGTIRDIVDSETQAYAKDNQSTIGKIMGREAVDEGATLDPSEELDRLEDEGMVTIKKRNEAL